MRSAVSNPPRRKLNEGLCEALNLPGPTLVDIIDSLSRLFLERPDPCKKGWFTSKVRHEGLSLAAHALVGRGWRFIEDSNSFCFLRHDDTNTDFVIFRGGKGVGSGTPDFHSVRRRRSSESAANAAQEEFDLFLEEADEGAIVPSRPGVQYLMLFIFFEETGTSEVTRVAQIAVNPRHNDYRVHAAEYIIDIDLKPWSEDDSESSSSDDGGTGALVSVGRRRQNGTGGSS